jgi:hypothetical protein
MTMVLYGKLRIDLVQDAGGLIRRTGTDAGWVSPPRRVRAPTVAVATPLGRAADVALALRMLGEGHTVNFYGPCGVGKTTLLRHLAPAAGRAFARPGAYLEVGADENPDDVVQRLLRKLGLIEPHVRATAEQSSRILAAVRPVVAIDKDDGGLSTLLGRLARCLVIVGSEHPLGGQGIASYELSGLGDDDASVLLRRDAGREFDVHERASAARLVAAVEGRPLPLRQAASLVRIGVSSFAALANAAERDPVAISRKAVTGLDRTGHDVVSILAVFAGVLLPADLVDIVGDSGKCREALIKLRERRVIESADDRFGFPACRAPGNIDHFFRTFDTTTAVRDIVKYVSAWDPGSDAALSMARPWSR